MEYLKKEAELKEVLRVKVVLGRKTRRAGFESATEQSEAKEKWDSPRPREGAVAKLNVFQVRKGASSSY